MDINTILKRLPEYINENRIKHSIGVKDTAVELAEIYGADKKKAEIAALLHDVARDLELDEMIKICSDKINNINKIVRENGALLHPYASRVIAERDFKIADVDILNAIENHTTGSKDMNLLDKIIFVADYIEPNRKFRGVKKARMLAYKNINNALLYIYKSVLIYLLREFRYICIETVEGYNSVLSG